MSLCHTFLDSDDDDAEVVNIQNKHWQMKEAETGRHASEIEGISISDRMKIVRNRHAEIMAAGLMMSKVASCSCHFSPILPLCQWKEKAATRPPRKRPFLTTYVVVCTSSCHR